MDPVPDFLFQAFILLAPALVAVGGGLMAFCFRKSNRVKRGITFGTAVLLAGVGLAMGRAGFHLATWGAPVFIGTLILVNLAASSPWFVALARGMASAVSLQSRRLRLSYLYLFLSPLLFAGGL